MIKFKSLILIICFGIWTCVYAQDFVDSFWIDVRTVNEYQQGHLDGAENIPHTEIHQRIAQITDDKQAKIHLYCVSGVRAQIAKNVLQGLGYENVINEGGLKDIKVAQ